MIIIERKMRKKIFSIILLLQLFIAVALPLIPALVSAADANPLTVDGTGIKKTAGTAGLKTSGTLSSVIGSIIGALLGILGTLFLLLIVVAGIQWMTAAGNDEKINSAKSTIIAATVGLMVIFLSYAFAKFIGQILSAV